MINTFLLTASLLYNTYYPIAISRTIPQKVGFISHANCEWYNNKCSRAIEDEYPNLFRYNHITINEIDMNVNVLFRRLLNYNISMYKHKHHVVASHHGERYEIISTPLSHNRTRVFIFANKYFR